MNFMVDQRNPFGVNQYGFLAMNQRNISSPALLVQEFHFLLTFFGRINVSSTMPFNPFTLTAVVVFPHRIEKRVLYSWLGFYESQRF